MKKTPRPPLTGTLKTVWDALPGPYKVWTDGQRYVYIRREPNRLVLVHLTSLTRKEQQAIIAGEYK